ncbi:MAG: hypothetical protein RLZZ612_2358 [Pseudomonadota bacterium]|jgi:iron complex transport system permease protein
MKQAQARWSSARTFAYTAGLLAVALMVAGTQGAYALSSARLLALLWEGMTGMWLGLAADMPVDAQVFLNIRLPRILLGVAAGAGLAVAGALMQGIFRNPLADPGLIGVSSGAALAAALTIVLGSVWWPELPRALGSWTLVLTAFVGGMLVTAVVYVLSHADTGARVGMMLLAGIAINAVAGAGLGLLSYIATDEQLRSLQFWMLGSLGGARWSAVGLVVGLVVVTLALALPLARALNALSLGEAQASLLGVDVRRLQQRAVLTAAVAVGAITATTGIIGFVGLIAPHVVRLLAGPDHRVLLPASALLGAALVLLADAAARTLAQPAELPLGVLTALLGGPFFLVLLRTSGGRAWH